MSRLLVVFLLLVAAPAAAQDDPELLGDDDDSAENGDDDDSAATEVELQPKQRQVKWMILPNASFDTDDGLGFGIRGELQKIKEGYDPFQASFILQAFVSLKGYHHHRFYVDLPGLGRQHRLRLNLRFAYRQWLNDGYWGIGNGTVRERAYVGDFPADDPRRKRYRYYLIQPYAYVGARYDLGDSPLSLFGSFVFQWVGIKTYAGSVLERDRPEGIGGGFQTQFSVGLMLDTRDPEQAPDRGVLAEISGRFTPGFPGSVGMHGGPYASIRGWLPLGGCDQDYPGFVQQVAARRAPKMAAKGKSFSIPANPFPGCRAVVAGRIMGEWLVGDVPFFEMARWGGYEPILGFGGSGTLRGASFGRYRAPGRAVANVELRLDVLRHRLFQSPFRWQIVPLADVGVVWGAGDTATDGGRQTLPVHPAVGMGLHVVWDQSFVGRIDMAVGPDAVLEPDGTITYEPKLGFYVMFDQTF